MSVDVGATYRTSIQVRDASGAPVNPVTAALTVTTPDQVPHAVSPANPPATAGLLLWDWPMAQPGLHRFDWLTTGPGTAQTDFEQARSFRSVISLADARDFLGYSGDTKADQKIRWMMAAATRLAERIVGTCVIRTFAGEWVTGDSRDVIGLPHGPLPSEASVTSLASVWAGGPSWVKSDLAVNAEAATLRLRSFLPFWFGPWKVTYTAGRTEIPDDVIEGVKEILWDLWATQRENLGGQQGPPLTEAAAFEAAVPPGYRIPGRALQYLEAERRPGFG